MKTHLKFLAWLWVWLCLGFTLPAQAAGGAYAIKNGGFVDPQGRAFVPHGFNYIRLFPGRSHDTFDPEHYDAGAIDAALARWEKDGFNVVRVFLHAAPNVAGTLAKANRAGLEAAYLRNVADFLIRAQRHHVGVMLCTESFPAVAPYRARLQAVPPTISPFNAAYLAAGHLQAKAQYLGDIIAGLKAANPGCLGAVFAYDLQNEFCYQASAPFTLTNGSVTAANGRTYQLPAQRQQLADDSAIHFIDTMVAAVRRAQPGALVGASVFTFAAVGKTGPGDFSLKKADWQNRYPFRPLAILRSQASYLDLHFYSADARGFERDLLSVEFAEAKALASQTGKPLLVGEFGVFKKRYPQPEPAAVWMQTLAQRFARENFAGWIYWTYDTHEQDDELWHARAQNDLIYQCLSKTLAK